MFNVSRVRSICITCPGRRGTVVILYFDVFFFSKARYLNPKLKYDSLIRSHRSNYPAVDYFNIELFYILVTIITHIFDVILSLY